MQSIPKMRTAFFISDKSNLPSSRVNVTCRLKKSLKKSFDGKLVKSH
jgi:hypothetical protein